MALVYSYTFAKLKIVPKLATQNCDDCLRPAIRKFSTALGWPSAELNNCSRHNKNLYDKKDGYRGYF
jgi:hypothetical protein